MNTDMAPMILSLVSNMSDKLVFVGFFPDFLVLFPFLSLVKNDNEQIDLNFRVTQNFRLYKKVCSSFGIFLGDRL